MNDIRLQIIDVIRDNVAALNVKLVDLFLEDMERRIQTITSANENIYFMPQFENEYYCLVHAYQKDTDMLFDSITTTLSTLVLDYLRLKQTERAFKCLTV